MQSVWTQHLKDPVEKQKFEDYVKGSKSLFNRLNEILDILERDLGRSETNPETFKDPSWAYLQAYKNGFRSCLERMKALTENN